MSAKMRAPTWGEKTKEPPKRCNVEGAGNESKACWSPDSSTNYNTPSQELKRSEGGFLPAKYRRRRRDLDLMGDARGDMHELVRRAVDAVRCGAGETAAALMRNAGRAVVDGGAK